MLVVTPERGASFYKIVAIIANTVVCACVYLGPQAIIVSLGPK